MIAIRFVVFHAANFDSPTCVATTPVTVWEALENAGKTVLTASSGATVNVVQHKYGSEAAEVVGQSFAVGADVFYTVNNVRSLGVKKLAKRAAKKSTISAGTLFGCPGQ